MSGMETGHLTPTHRWREWTIRKHLLLLTIKAARKLMSLRIERHGRSRCACPWCQLDRAIGVVVAHIEGRQS